MTGNILYFDCSGGISGDMAVGALLDLGLDQDKFRGELATLGVDGYEIEISRSSKRGLSGTDFAVHLLDHDHPHRNLHDIDRIIADSALGDAVKARAHQMFGVVAEAEAEVHGKPLEEVHFHEVGAVDSIVDIVGVAICIEMLSPCRILSSPVHLGSGFIECAHGRLPVPVPATAAILKGIEVYSTGVEAELVTPTGASILKVLAEEFGPLPSMKLRDTGYGLGKRDIEHTNILRVIAGEPAGTVRERVVVVECNIDDMNPEVYSHLVPLLLSSGALDAFLTSITMKKGRPGVMVSVLCSPEKRPEIEEILLRETTTLGLRHHIVDRTCMDRSSLTLDTQYGPVVFKASGRGGVTERVTPEYEECRRIARSNGVPLLEVYTNLVAEAVNRRKEPEG